MEERPGDVWSNGSTVRLLPACALQLPPFHSTTSTQLKIVFCTEWNDLIYVRQKRVHWMFAITRGRSSPTSFGWHLNCIEGRHKRNRSSFLHNNLVPFCTIIEIQLVFSGQGEGRHGNNAQIRGKHDKRHFIRFFFFYERLLKSIVFLLKGCIRTRSTWPQSAGDQQGVQYSYVTPKQRHELLDQLGTKKPENKPANTKTSVSSIAWKHHHR